MKQPDYKDYQNTTVAIEKSQADISKLLRKYGIYEVQHTNQKEKFSLAFRVEIEEMSVPLTVRIDIPYNQRSDKEDKYGYKKQRILYRTLFFYVKGLLNAWNNDLKTFTEIFMPHLVLPNGETVEQVLLPQFRKAITENKFREIKLLE